MPKVAFKFVAFWLKSPTLSTTSPAQMLTLSHFTGGIAQTNGWLVQSQDRAIAIDAPEGFAAWLAAQSIKLEALLLTHQHFDHVLDAAAIAAAHACPVIAFAPNSPDLTLERLFGISAGISFSVTPFTVTDLVTEASTLELLGTAWTILHVPGHSPDSLCFHAPATGHLFGGDVLFRDGIGRTDFPGGSTRTLLEGIQNKILALPDTTQVHPGHGPSTTIGRERLQNPFLLDD
jgi:glyoxylase-like metal-dependent hydrolase (beta-lactamase superfamily II)